MTGCPQWEEATPERAPVVVPRVDMSDEAPDAMRIEKMTPPELPWWAELEAAGTSSCPPDSDELAEVLDFDDETFILPEEPVFHASTCEDAGLDNSISALTYVDGQALLVTPTESAGAEHEGHAITGAQVTSMGGEMMCEGIALRGSYDVFLPPMTLHKKVWLTASGQDKDIVFGYDLEEGLLWQRTFDSASASSPRAMLVTEDGQLLLAQGDDLVSLSARDGTFLWSAELAREGVLIGAVEQIGEEILVQLPYEVVILNSCGELLERIPTPVTSRGRMYFLGSDRFAVMSEQDEMIFFNRESRIHTLQSCRTMWSIGQGQFACLKTSGLDEVEVRVVDGDSGETVHTWDVDGASREVYPWVERVTVHTNPVGLGSGKFAMGVTLGGDEPGQVRSVALVYDSRSGALVHEEIDEAFHRLGQQLFVTRSGELVWPSAHGVWIWKVASSMAESGEYPSGPI